MMDEELEWDEGTVTLCRVREKEDGSWRNAEREVENGHGKIRGWDSGPAFVEMYAFMR